MNTDTTDQIPLTAKNVALFWKKVHKTETCWIWIGSKWNNGYGRMMVCKKRRKAHRISYLIHNGILPNDKLVCHHCDNPSCVNPHHLFLGTIADNSADMKSKGRSTHGSRNGMAKLTEQAVIEIRSSGISGRKAVGEIAERFGTSLKTIYNAKSRLTWKMI